MAEYALYHVGPNGPLPKEITNLHPNATYVRRNGEVDAWSNEEFREAVKATGKTQIILAGITTDVCQLFQFYGGPAGRLS